jgi:putative PIN family toxin of toxin-antitoxin system
MMLRAVIDTNVLVSGLLADEGAPGMIREAFRKAAFTWCISPALMEEYQDVLSRAKFRRAFEEHARVSPVDFLSDLGRAAEMVEGVVLLPVVPDDPDDDIIVATAVAAEADYVVSGDQHLLKLGVYKDIRIVTPKEFVVLLAHSS